MASVPSVVRQARRLMRWSTSCMVRRSRDRARGRGQNSGLMREVEEQPEPAGGILGLLTS